MSWRFVCSLVVGLIPVFRPQNTSIQILKQRRGIFQNYLLSLDTIIRQFVICSTTSKDSQQWLDTQTAVSVITDNDGVLIRSIVSSCSPSLLACLKEWQQAAHILACIDIATYYISQMTTEDKNHMDSPTDRICKTMIATILAFPLPMINLPADPRPDDPERIRDRRVFTDEPQMQALITSLDDTSRMALADAAERVRMRLPLLPACFRDWEAQDKMTCI